MYRTIPNHKAGESSATTCKILGFVLFLLNGGAAFAAFYVGTSEAGEAWHLVAGAGFVVGGAVSWAVLSLLAYLAECLGFIAQNTPLNISKRSAESTEALD